MLRMGYGQHQSFYLRVNWLRKAIRQLREEPKFLFKEEAAEQIGLGKNMVQSLKHWVFAAEIVDDKTDQTISTFGDLMNSHDPYIEIKDTASIIHYHLVDDKEPCTAWYWFFNHYSIKSSSKEHITNEFLTWINVNETKKPSVNSVKRDIDCLIRLYCEKDKVDDPEEVIQSPLSIIGLLHEEKSIVTKRNMRFSDIGLGALMYCLLRFHEKSEVSSITVNDLEKNELLWGRVFHLQRNEIIKALEELTVHPYHPITFDRTNRLDTIQLPIVSSIEFLENEYKRITREHL